MTPYARIDAEILRRHSIRCDGYAPDFCAGALLGNGGLGCVVTTRPDSLLLHFGHNSVWDIRLKEVPREELRTFREIFARIQSLPKGTCVADDPWLRAYFELTGAPYREAYPRPFPCGSLLLGFDRRETTLLGHFLELETGRCRVELAHQGERFFLEIFCDQTADRLWLRGLNAAGEPSPLPFTRLRLLPDPHASKGLPPYVPWIGKELSAIGFDQTLPAKIGEISARDRFVSCVLHAASGIGEKHPDLSTLIWLEAGDAGPENDVLHRRFASSDPFLACAEFRHGGRCEKEAGVFAVPDLTVQETAAFASRQDWLHFWSRSEVRLEDDPLLERVWYRNLYFFHCAVRPGQACPGLFANWSYLQIGTAWHGDWHLNYNTQQPFWLCFSSNHVEHHLPYVDMVDHITEVAEWTAAQYFGLRGAYYPHSAYPVEMTVPPYLVPTWGWEICETPWAVQSLWWHFLYTQDVGFLRERTFPRLRQAARFIADYLLRPEASGRQPEGLWEDDLYHVFPTVVPELYGLEPGFRRNFDVTADLTLIRFLFRAVREALAILGLEQKETELAADIERIFPKLPEYPTAPSPRGEVFVCVPGEDPEIVQNCPVSTMMVFPGEDIGLGSSRERYEMACRTFRNQNNEGGNDLVQLSMQAARLGILDLEAFKRHIRYCLMPNGTCANMVMQSMGRYHDTSERSWMARLGIWFENFSLPAVINECLLQSYDGVIRLFPNWPLNRQAAFHNLRAVGAFLVTASCDRGKIEHVEVLSEAGKTLCLLNPWPAGARIFRNGVASGTSREPRLTFSTSVDERLAFSKDEGRS